MRETDGRSDDELLAAMANGDRGALRVLYDRHAPWLLMRLSRRSVDRGAVDEVLQDTFLAVWRKPGAFRGQGEVGAWIWGIAIRRMIDALRRTSARERIASVGRNPVEALRRTRHSTVTSAEEQALLGVEHGDLAGALNRLSPELRAVLQATVLDGLTTAEAGRLLGIPPGTVKTRAMRARIQLREELASP